MVSTFLNLIWPVEMRLSAAITEYTSIRALFVTFIKIRHWISDKRRHHPHSYFDILQPNNTCCAVISSMTQPKQPPIHLSNVFFHPEFEPQRWAVEWWKCASSFRLRRNCGYENEKVHLKCHWRKIRLPVISAKLMSPVIMWMNSTSIITLNYSWRRKKKRHIHSHLNEQKWQKRITAFGSSSAKQVNLGY